ncbi:hypothetical protein AB0M45_33205 [Nocardia sp. NPDC051787]|uniref:hypothetical protein n=1 Tax=Nocardia sp. NPDC051787 TaxID=3155415 RepID=UPI00341291AF
MAAALIRLKVELRQKHLQTHSAFCREYDRVAQTIDPALVGTSPGRAQFHRWLSGALKGLPYPHHCRVLEKMFPGYTAAQLFERCADNEPIALLDTSTTVVDNPRGLLGVIENRLRRPTFGVVDWASEQPGDASSSDAGLATDDARGVSKATQQLAQRLLQLEKAQRVNSREVSQFAHLAGHIIDLDTRIDIQISGDGSARLTYRYETLNMTDRPLTRMSRELWFKYTERKLDIRPLRESSRRLAIQRIHDTPSLSKFACQLSPAIQPGESAVVGYTCEGGKFVDELYWRQSIHRYTRRFAIHLRHGDAGDLISCSAVEEHQDGAENSATEDLIWDYEGDDVIVTLTREYLRPNQSVTLRWEVSREHS